MWEASPRSGLRCVPLFELHPGPIRISSRSPRPLSSRTARHRLPSAVRVKLTPLTAPPLPLPVSSPPPTSSPVVPVVRVGELPTTPPLRRAEGAMEPPVDDDAGGPATAALPAEGAVALPAAAPVVLPVGAVVPATVGADDDGTGAAAEAGGDTELVPDGVLFAAVLTVVGGAVVGVVVLVSVVPTDEPLAVASLLADSRTASDGFDPPLPVVATVVVGAATVVLVAAGAAVVGGVVPTVALLGAVPWVPVEVPAGAGAGAVWAEAGRAFRTRKRPARSAKDAAHLRGRTTSILVWVLIGPGRPPCLDRGREGRRTLAGTREV